MTLWERLAALGGAAFEALRRALPFLAGMWAQALREEAARQEQRAKDAEAAADEVRKNFAEYEKYRGTPDDNREWLRKRARD